LTIVDEQVAEVPSQLRRSIKALSEKSRLAILLVLLKNDEMTFSELSRTLDMSSSKLTHHLKKLVQAALVENYFQRKADSEEYSFYKPTLLAEDFARNMLGILDYTNLLEGALLRFQKPFVYHDIFAGGFLEQADDRGALSLLSKSEYRLPLYPRRVRQMPREYEMRVKRTVTEYEFTLFPKVARAHKSYEEELEELLWKY
jgi:DNA-binding transcriptional ArsR family regulator